MASGKQLPVFLFIKQIGCPPCNAFYEHIYYSKDKKDQRLLNDVQLAGKVEFRIVEIGFDKEKKIIKTLDSVYPDMVPLVKTVPFLWFHPPRQRSKGVRYTGQHSVADVKEWILQKIKEWNSTNDEEDKDDDQIIDKDELKLLKESVKESESDTEAAKGKGSIGKNNTGTFIHKGMVGPSGKTKFVGKS